MTQVNVRLNESSVVHVEYEPLDFIPESKEQGSSLVFCY